MCLQFKPLFDAHIAKTSCGMSAYHFSSILAWDAYFSFSFELIENQLCVFANQGKDTFLYLPPLGEEINQDVVTECFKRMGKSSIARIENILDNQLPAFRTNGYNQYLKAHEYVYRNQDLQQLSGNKYKSKRHDVHVFLKHFPQARFREFCEKDLDACRQLYEFWEHSRKSKVTDSIYVQMLEENKNVHARLMQHAKDLDLIGRVVEIDGDIVGYTFGFKLNADTFCVLLEVVDLTKAGLGTFIFNSFCQDPVVKDFTFINTMDDFGMPNIAAAKMKYYPVNVMPIYSIKA